VPAGRAGAWRLAEHHLAAVSTDERGGRLLQRWPLPGSDGGQGAFHRADELTRVPERTQLGDYLSRGALQFTPESGMIARGAVPLAEGGRAEQLGSVVLALVLQPACNGQEPDDPLPVHVYRYLSHAAFRHAPA
jgi:hypothetical protein